MGRRTFYCANCMNSFVQDDDRCPNLGCGTPRPDKGWGVLLGKGDLLDRHYYVQQVLAVGGAGITYLAQEIDENGQPHAPDLAIKVLFAQRDAGPFLRRLANEAQILQELAHENIVACYGFVNRMGREPYLLTLFEPGGNLYDHVKKVGPLPPLVAGGVMTQILRALDVAHHRGVVHRDLKPQNVLLRTAVPREVIPRCLVADFGIAKVEGGLNEGLTQVGTFVGTPEFAAPEQFRGAAPEPATDVFAAGALLFYLLTGRPPVQFSHRRDIGTSLMELLDQVPPLLVGPAANPILQRVLSGTMQPEIADRWTIQQVLTTLRELNEHTTTRPDGTIELTAHDQEPAIIEAGMHATMVPGMDGDLATFHMQDTDDLPKELSEDIERVARPDGVDLQQAETRDLDAAPNLAHVVPASLRNTSNLIKPARKKTAAPAAEPAAATPPPAAVPSTPVAVEPQPAPTASPAPQPPAVRPAPAPPAPPPEPPRRTRMRLRDTEPSGPAPQPAFERKPMSLDDLFDSSTTNDAVVNAPQPGNDLSLDDLFGDLSAPAAPAPAPEPPPQVARQVSAADFWGEPVQDADYETVMEDEVAPPPAVPAPAAPLTETWMPQAPASLPSPLPNDAGALVQLLGSVHPDARGPVVEALRTTDPGSVLSNREGDVATRRGIGLAIALLDKTAYANAARALLSDGDPGVRACAAEAIGAVGSAATMVQLNRLLDDGDPEVRRVGAFALAHGGVRTGRQDLVRGWIQRLAGDGDAGVQAACAEALARL